MDSDCQHLPDVERRKEADVVVCSVLDSVSEFDYGDHRLDGRCRSSAQTELVGDPDDRARGEPCSPWIFGLVGLEVKGVAQRSSVENAELFSLVDTLRNCGCTLSGTSACGPHLA